MSTLKKIIWKEHLKPRLHKSEYYWNSILLITWTRLPFTSSESAHRNRIFLKALSIGFLVTWLWKKNLLVEKKCRKSLEFKIKSHLFEKLFDTELYKTAMYYSGTFILRNLSNANISLHQINKANLLLVYKNQKDKTPLVFLCIKFPYQASSGFAFLNTRRLRAACWGTRPTRFSWLRLSRNSHIAWSHRFSSKRGTVCSQECFTGWCPFR